MSQRFAQRAPTQLREQQAAIRIIQVLMQGSKKYRVTTKIEAGAKKGSVTATGIGGTFSCVWTHTKTQRLGVLAAGVAFAASARHTDLKPMIIVPLEDLHEDGKVDTYTPAGQFAGKMDLSEYMGNQLLEAIHRPEKFDRTPKDPVAWTPDTGSKPREA
jgi:hypothetical protein